MESLIWVRGPHAGEVIVSCADDWPWSAAELAHPDWRIVRSPLTEIEARALVGPLMSSTEIDRIKGERRYRLNAIQIAALARTPGGRVLTRGRALVLDADDHLPDLQAKELRELEQRPRRV